MQLLTRRKNGSIDGETWESLLRLESHIDEMRAAGGQKWSEVELMAQGAWALSMTQMMFTVEMATEMLGRASIFIH
jgi:SET and MYND domain-containing protein